MNRRLDIREDIKRYQDTLSCAQSKVDYCVGENLYMLPSDMNLWKFILGKNDEVISGTCNEKS